MKPPSLCFDALLCPCFLKFWWGKVPCNVTCCGWTVTWQQSKSVSMSRHRWTGLGNSHNVASCVTTVCSKLLHFGDGQAHNLYFYLMMTNIDFFTRVIHQLSHIFANYYSYACSTNCWHSTMSQHRNVTLELSQLSNPHLPVGCSAVNMLIIKSTIEINSSPSFLHSLRRNS